MRYNVTVERVTRYCYHVEAATSSDAIERAIELDTAGAEPYTSEVENRHASSVLRATVPGELSKMPSKGKR